LAKLLDETLGEALGGALGEALGDALGIDAGEMLLEAASDPAAAKVRHPWPKLKQTSGQTRLAHSLTHSVSHSVSRVPIIHHPIIILTQQIIPYTTGNNTYIEGVGRKIAIPC
jgi:hypothetical protein